jgi:hypothetical protein
MFNPNMIQLQQQSTASYQPKPKPTHQEPPQAKQNREDEDRYQRMNIINAITGGCNSPEHLTKRQKKEQQREVSHVCAGKVFKTEWSQVPITFTEADLKLKKYPHEYSLVIRAVLGKNTKYLLGNDVGGILVDNGSSADIITYELFKRMEFRDDQLQKTSKPLYGFSNKKVEALGTIEMNVSLRTRALMRTEMVNFDVVDIPYAHKAMNKFVAVIHMPFLCMKIL